MGAQDSVEDQPGTHTHPVLQIYGQQEKGLCSLVAVWDYSCVHQPALPIEAPVLRAASASKSAPLSPQGKDSQSGSVKR